MKYHRDDDDIFVEYDLEPDGYAEFSWRWLWTLIIIVVLITTVALWFMWNLFV